MHQLKLDPCWGETPETLLRRSSKASHARVRERFLALALAALGNPATEVAKLLGRNPQTVQRWVQQFNAKGPEGSRPHFPGNPSRRLLSDEELAQLKAAIQQSPRQVGFPRGRWTGKLIMAFVKQRFGQTIAYRTAIGYLHRLNFVRKRPRKRLKKADPNQQKAFAAALQQLERSRCARSVTVYLNQGQIWMDVLLRLMWCLKGKPAEVDSCSPGKKKLRFYVAVVRPLGGVITLQVDWFNQENTARFLEKIRSKLEGYRIDLVWDSAPWNRGPIVRDALGRDRIHSQRLPAYSPEMNAAEPWIKWVKEVLSENTCWWELKALVRAFNGFVASMSRRAQQILRRCVPQTMGSCWQ